jgi:hypothetical protein
MWGQVSNVINYTLEELLAFLGLILKHLKAFEGWLRHQAIPRMERI